MAVALLATSRRTAHRAPRTTPARQETPRAIESALRELGAQGRFDAILSSQRPSTRESVSAALVRQLERQHGSEGTPAATSDWASADFAALAATPADAAKGIARALEQGSARPRARTQLARLALALSSIEPVPFAPIFERLATVPIPESDADAGAVIFGLRGWVELASDGAAKLERAVRSQRWKSVQALRLAAKAPRRRDLARSHR